MEPQIAFNHRWPWEVARWRELVFALLTQSMRQPEPQIRDLTEHLGSLELLDVQSLSNLTGRNGKVDYDQPLAKQIADTFLEWGASVNESRDSIAAISQAAKGLQKHYQSKVQLYLRHYAFRMLDDVEGTFTFKTLTPVQVRQAFAYWLQNILGMPLSLKDATFVAFCDRFGITPAELTSAADELDLNLAVLDDAIHSFVTRVSIDTRPLDADTSTFKRKRSRRSR